MRQHERVDIALIPFSGTVARPVATARLDLAPWACNICKAVLCTQAGAGGPPQVRAFGAGYVVICQIPFAVWPPSPVCSPRVFVTIVVDWLSFNFPP